MYGNLVSIRCVVNTFRICFATPSKVPVIFYGDFNKTESIGTTITRYASNRDNIKLNKFDPEIPHMKISPNLRTYESRIMVTKVYAILLSKLR